MFFQACISNYTKEKNQNALILLNQNELLLARNLYQDGNTFYSNDVDSLKGKADKLLNVKPYSVMQKRFVPPSGSKHDFYSLGPYWWPNPETNDGLPYIRKDGVRNPEYEAYDGKIISKMAGDVYTLTLAYFYTQNEHYAQKAIELLRVWFLDPETLMNPNLNFGQAIPGITEGRGIGIIETACFVPLMDAIIILHDSGAMLDTMYLGLKHWFSSFNQWLLTSQLGWDERMWLNNHGSSYDSQILAFSQFSGNDAALIIILDSLPLKRMALQIKPDGSQPLELERTKAMGYSLYNLEHLAHCAIIAQNHHVNLWNVKTDSSGSIMDALYYLIPFFTDDKVWEYEQLGGIKKQINRLYALLYLVYKNTNDTALYNAMISLQKTAGLSREFILSYPPASAKEKTLAGDRNF